MRRRSKAALSIHHVRIEKPTVDDHLAVLARAVFQAGLSWAQIDRQWQQLAETFDRFVVTSVARYGDVDVKRIGATPGIVHSDRKTRAVVEHARTLLMLERDYGSVQKYLRSHSDYDALVHDIRRRFPYVGDISAYYYLYRVGEAVPPFGRWIRTVKGDHPRIKEMVAGHVRKRTVQTS